MAMLLAAACRGSDGDGEGDSRAGAPAAGAGGSSGHHGGDAGGAGDAADAGRVADGDVDDAGAGLQPVVIIRGDPNQAEWWDLTVRGELLDAFDGAIANVRIGHPDRPPERLGSGQAVVERGSFELTFPRVWEASLYKVKDVFIDADRDGVCESSTDLVFTDARAAAPPDFTLTVHDGDSTAAHDFHRSSNAAADCAELNAPWPAQ